MYAAVEAAVVSAAAVVDKDVFVVGVDVVVVVVLRKLTAVTREEDVWSCKLKMSVVVDKDVFVVGVDVVVG